MEDAYLARWTILQASDVMRNKRYDLTARRVTGPLGAVVQLNPEHIRTKRPPSVAPAPAAATAVSVSRPFNPAAFNFTKCKDGELLATIADESSADVHYIYINVNPLLTGHGLLVPARDACHPQVLTRQLLLPSVRVFVAAGCHRRDFKIGFNSVGAWASVNHCHMHCFYVGDVFPDGCTPVEHARSEMLHTWGALQLCRQHWALPALVFCTAMPCTPPAVRRGEESADAATMHSTWTLPVIEAAAATALQSLCHAAGAYIERLVHDNVAHTVLIWRTPCDDATECISIAVFARQYQQGGGAEAGEMAIALAEASGVGIVHTQADFDTLTGPEYERRLRSSALDDATYVALEAVAAACCSEAVAAAAAGPS